MSKRNALRAVRNWLKNYPSDIIEFKAVEDKVYECCRGLDYNSTMWVFHEVLMEFGPRSTNNEVSEQHRILG